MFETFPINKTQHKQVKISMHLISGGRMENMYYINAKFQAPGRGLGGGVGNVFLQVVSSGRIEFLDYTNN